MTPFNLNTFSQALNESSSVESGVDFSGKSLKLDSEKDAQPIVDAINSCKKLHYLTLTGNTLGVKAAIAIAKALERHPEFRIARWSDMFTGRMKTEIPPALSALGDGMIQAGARLSVLDLSDNAFGPIGVEGLARLLQSDVCSQLQELRLNNNGLGITGARLLSKALEAQCPRLKVFIAGRNRLENDGATALAAVFKKMGSLEEVAMPQNGIYHPGISALSEAFKHNPHLTCLNLNDNTIGPKGAVAVALALPKLKSLRSINFGDCLLKSKGAVALADGFKLNSVQLESLDLSHNEIGRDACVRIVDAITLLPDSADRLSRVVLAGNRLGGPANKKLLRDKLGPSAELSDGEDSDESGDESGDESEASEASEDSATEDAQHQVSLEDQSLELDCSGIQEVESEVGQFLANPSIDNYKKLGANVVDVIDTHLQVIKDPSSLIQAYVEATLLISGLSSDNSSAKETARLVYRVLVKRASQQHASSWILADAMLRGFALIKSESNYKIRWHIPSCFEVLSSVIDESYFPESLRDTIKFFVKSKMDTLPEDVKNVVNKHENLYK